MLGRGRTGRSRRTLLPHTSSAVILEALFFSTGSMWNAECTMLAPPEKSLPDDTAADRRSANFNFWIRQLTKLVKRYWICVRKLTNAQKLTFSNPTGQNSEGRKGFLARGQAGLVINKLSSSVEPGVLPWPEKGCRRMWWGISAVELVVLCCILIMGTPASKFPRQPGGRRCCCNWLFFTCCLTPLPPSSCDMQYLVDVQDRCLEGSVHCSLRGGFQHLGLLLAAY